MTLNAAEIFTVLIKHRNSVIDEIQTFWVLNTMVLTGDFNDIYFHIPIKDSQAYTTLEETQKLRQVFSSM